MSEIRQIIENAITDVEVIAPEVPADKPAPRDKRPLTHRLSATQLQDIQRNMTVPVPQTQNPDKFGHKKHEGKARRQPTHRSTVMSTPNTDTVPAVPQSNNGTVTQAAPPAKSAQDAQAIVMLSEIPYGRAAAKGAIFGASAAAAGSLVFFGGRWVYRKIQGSGTP